MKKYLLMGFALTNLLIACGGGETPKEAKSTATETPATPERDENYSKGLALVAQSDCLTCHKVEEKLIGPAYKEIAAKYEATEENIRMLAEKIIKGGKGNWGEIPMTPHPNISQEDAETMVKYVLQLK